MLNRAHKSVFSTEKIRPEALRFKRGFDIGVGGAAIESFSSE
jgi:hypothetical protein